MTENKKTTKYEMISKIIKLDPAWSGNESKLWRRHKERLMEMLKRKEKKENK